jgi:predicted DNA-binding transcriptional regulator YafY
MADKQTRPRMALPRIYSIDEDIASDRYPNESALAKKYRVGKATIHRDIDFMRKKMNAPIKYDGKRRGYYYENKTYRLPAGFTTGNDLAALAVAKSLLALYKNQPFYEEVSRLLNSLAGNLDEKKLAWYEKHIVVLPAAEASFDSDAWFTIFRCMAEKKLVKFKYRGSKDARYRNRFVYPYQLIFDKGRWIMYGILDDSSEPRLFSLSRMKDAVKTNGNFNLPENYDFRPLIGGSFFGIYHGDSVLSYKIRFSGRALPIIKERKWANDQTFAEENDSLTLMFSSTQFGDILHWVLNFGQDAVPLEPKELVDEWRENVKNMAMEAQK